MLNYKKILLDNNVESGNQSPVERTDEQRLNDLRKEINELVDNNQQNDSIDTIANDMVNDSLKQAISKLQINERLHLLAIVDKAIQSQADGNIKTSLTKLRGLLDTNEQNEANSDFQRFENFIVKRNFSKLNSLKNNIDDIVKHINQMSTTDAVWLLSKMKPDWIDQTSWMWSLVWNWHKTDRAVYDAILLAISNKVEGKSEEWKDQRALLKQDEYWIIKEQLNQFFGNNPKAKDLQELLYLYSWKTDWNWNDIGDIIPSSGNPKLLFNNVQFGSKFKELNDKRINNNKKIVKDIRISINDINDFTIDNDTIKYKNNEVTINDMIKICNLNLNGCDFLNNKERDDLLTSKFNEFKNKIEKELENKDKDQNWKYQALEDWEQGRLMTEDRINKINEQAKENAFLEAVNKDGQFDTYNYNLTKAKAYLKTFAEDTSFQRNKLKDVEKNAYVAAVQILLNNTDSTTSSKIMIDWEFWKQTRDRVTKYQKLKRLREDWIPWPDTLKDLLGMGQATR